MLIEAGALQRGPASEKVVTPYPGLRPFSEQDSRLFFGREQEIGALLAILESQQLVVVHGASGCGKSSLVRAGLLPVFRMDAAANSKRGHVVIVRPADEGGPLQSLARKLDAELELAPDPEREAKKVEGQSWSTILTTSQNWARDIGARVDSGGGALCIVFDQFEEIFAANKIYAAQVNRVIDFLNSLSEPSPEGTALGGRPISVVVTMRSDYLGNCAIWEGFAETVNRCQYLLPRIGAVGLLRAIHEPARLAGGKVDPQVAESLLRVVKSEMDGLPIVQHVLSRAWYLSTFTRGSRDIDVDATNAVGGAECALSDHADDVYSAATGGEPARENIADCMLRSLSDLDTDGRIIRRSIPLEQLEREVGAPRAELEAVLAPFRRPENSLIMPPLSEPLADNTVISVTHEALLRQWKRISDAAFDDQGSVTGLAYRELLDGMIWRALSVQAQQFAKDGTSILGPAATQQRLPWYRELERRPGWIVRHDPQIWSRTGTELQRPWQQVAGLMAASEKNLAAEEQKLERERELVAKLRHSQKMLWWLQVAVVALVALIMIPLIANWREELRTARLEKVDAQAQLYRADIDTAHAVAQRYCEARSLDDTEVARCVDKQSREYLEQIKVNKSKKQNPVNANPLPASPLGGGIGTASPQGELK